MKQSKLQYRNCYNAMEKRRDTVINDEFIIQKKKTLNVVRNIQSSKIIPPEAQ